MVALISYRIADALVRVLPARAADRLAVVLGRAAFALRLPARRALEANLGLLSGGATPAAVRDRARSAFEHFALTFTDFLRLARLGSEALDRAIEVRGAEHLAAARASGRGVILLSAHIGNWEWGAAYLGARGTRLHVVARPHPSAPVEEFFARRRRRWGVRPLAARPLWTRAAEALRRREWVALMGDRGAPGARGSVSDWAEALARRTGALVLPAVMVRLAVGRYAACFDPPLAAGARVRDRFRAAVLRHLERHPGQWCAFEPLPEGLA
ncbi:MAG TPA: lysophospholipid acyltransferase family protein [Candidatus Eisenbacteria bacterium]|jgi:KDO2-lipid IV(A) lauroyltransferase